MMHPTRVLILAALTVIMAACGGPSEPEPGTTPPAASQAPEPAVQDEQQPVAVIEESAGESKTVSEDAGDKIVLPDKPPAAPVTQKFSVNTHYIKLTTAQGTSSPPDVIEAAEVFWYGCPHCFNFDPIINNWAGKLPDDVNFIRIPVMWNPTNAIHARLYYTLEALGRLEDIHAAVFNEMHVNKKMLTGEAEIREFVGKHGISAEDFDKTFRSFAVESKLKRAQNLTTRYRIQSVPLLVINGKYLTTGDGIKTFDEMLAVADELIALERSDR